MKETINEILLQEALECVLRHLWEDRKRDVKKNFSLMAAEAQARKVLHQIKESSEKNGELHALSLLE